MAKHSKKKPAYARPSFWVTSVVLIALFSAGAWAWRAFYCRTYRLDHLLVSINGEARKVLPGERLTLHPRDRVKILDIATNIPLNAGVRLAAVGLDAGALRYDEMPLSDLLTGRDLFNRYRFRVYVKYRNAELGHMDWEVQPYREDWLEKAARLINPDERTALLERALRVMPGDGEIRRVLLADYQARKMWKRAAALLESMVRKRRDRRTLDRLLSVYAAMGNRNGMISSLRRILKIAPGDSESRRRLAELLEKKGDLKGAIREYETLLKSSRKAGDRLKGTIPGLCEHIGYLYTKTGNDEKAISYYLQAVKQAPSDANLYYNLSYLYEKRHQREKADDFLAKALRLRREDMQGRLELAERRMAAGRLKAAEQYLKQVLRRDPRSREALVLMARLREKQGRKKDLRKVYEKVLSLEPGNETVAYNLAGLLYEAGDLTGSLKYFRRYLKRHPDDGSVHDILFDIYKKTGDEKNALREARTLMRLKPKEMGPYRYVFNYWNGRGGYDRLIPVLLKGIKAGPGGTELREYLVLAYVKTGKEIPAMEQMKEILKKKPEDVDLLLSLARLLEKHGRINEALARYKQVIDLSPDNEEAQEGYLRLRLKGVQEHGAR